MLKDIDIYAPILVNVFTIIGLYMVYTTVRRAIRSFLSLFKTEELRDMEANLYRKGHSNK